eukprot:6203426-Pleurochrysis_carterae.AAC.5
MRMSLSCALSESSGMSMSPPPRFMLSNERQSSTYMCARGYLSRGAATSLRQAQRACHVSGAPVLAHECSSSLESACLRRLSHRMHACAAALARTKSLTNSRVRTRSHTHTRACAVAHPWTCALKRTSACPCVHQVLARIYV